MNFLLLGGLLLLVRISKECASTNLTIGCLGCERFFPTLDCDTGVNFGLGYTIQIRDFGDETQMEEYNLKLLKKELEDTSSEIDVFLVKTEHIPSILSYLQPFDLNTPSQFSVDFISYYIDNMFPELLSDVVFNETHFAVPFASDRSCIWYRTDMQSVFSFPDPPWTLNEFFNMTWRIRNNIGNSGGSWPVDYEVFALKALLSEDLTGLFAEILQISSAKISYDDSTGLVEFTNRSRLIESFEMFTEMVKNRVIYEEFLETNHEEESIKWKYYLNVFIRKFYSFRNDPIITTGSPVGSVMKCGTIEGVTSQKQYSFVMRKTPQGLNSESDLFEAIEKIISFDNYTTIKDNLDGYMSKPVMNDPSEYSKFCSNPTLCPPAEVIVSKPYIQENFYFLLSLHIQTTVKSILLTGFVEKNIKKLESELQAVFNINPISPTYWLYWYWVITLVVVGSIVITLFPVCSLAVKCCECGRGLFVRYKFKKFHIENAETRKKIWEYFRLSLRTVFIFAFIVFLFCSVGMIYLIMNANTSNAVNLLETEWKSQVLLRVNDALRIMFSEQETEQAIDNAKTKLFDLLTTIKVSDNSILFTVDHEGTVIASGHTHVERERHISTSKHPIVKDFSNYMESTFIFDQHDYNDDENFTPYQRINLRDGEEVEEGLYNEYSYTFTSANEMIWLDGMKFKSTGVHWLVFIITPSNDLLSQINDGNALSVIASMIIIIASTALSIVITVVMTAELRNLASQMRQVEGMDLSMSFKKKSVFEEVAAIQERFMELIDTLKEYKKYLPSDLQIFDVDKTGNAEEGQDGDTLSLISQSLGFGDLTEELNEIDNKSVRLDNRVQSIAVRQQLAKKSITKKECTLLLVKLTNFDDFVELVAQEDFIEIHTKYIEVVTKKLSDNKGTFTTFFGSSIFGYFNASRNCANHESAAAKTALALRKEMKKLNKKLGQLDYPEFQLSISIVTDQAFCGNLGTEEVRSFSVIGNPVSKCERLESLNSDYTSTIMVNRECVDEICDQYLCWPVDIVSFDNGANREIIFELSGKITQKNQEKFAPFQEAIDLFTEEKFDDAKQLVKQIMFKGNKSTKSKYFQRFFNLLMKLSLKENTNKVNNYYVDLNMKKQAKWS